MKYTDKHHHRLTILIFRTALISSILLLCSCESFEVTGFEKELSSIQVEAEVRHRPIDINFNVKFTDLDVDARVWSNTILVDQTVWLTLDHHEREYTLLHELGHLLYDMEHGDNPIMNGSIMRATYQWNKDKWLDEYFNVHNQGSIQ